ncbi:hypothetical protein BaRGS_00010106, partial [Batillaria attramentaria]
RGSKLADTVREAGLIAPSRGVPRGRGTRERRGHHRFVVIESTSPKQIAPATGAMAFPARWPHEVTTGPWGGDVVFETGPIGRRRHGDQAGSTVGNETCPSPALPGFSSKARRFFVDGSFARPSPRFGATDARSLEVSDQNSRASVNFAARLLSDGSHALSGRLPRIDQHINSPPSYVGDQPPGGSVGAGRSLIDPMDGCGSAREGESQCVSFGFYAGF